MKRKIGIHTLNLLFDRADTRFVRRKLNGLFVYTNDDGFIDELKIKNCVVLWRQKNGRWRNEEKDKKITYEITDGFLEIDINGQKGIYKA